MASEYLDCEVYLSDESHARLSVAGREHTGRVGLDEALRHRLRKAALDPNDYGTLLFDALFRGAGEDLLAGYHEALTLARHDRRRLRLRLHLAVSAPAELHDLDWELLYDSQQRIAFGRSQEMAFSRYLSVPLEASPAVEERPKLLVVIAVPDDLADYGLPELDQSAIGEAVDRALRPLAGLVSCELLGPPVTAGRLRDRLRAGGVHVLHVVAHGCVHANAAVASLVFEGDDRKAFFVDENLLAEIVEGDRDLRLISLIACHSGAVSGTDPFRGLGPALVRRGAPAVVAMRRAIRVEAAALFSEHLFRDLARCGRIDAAVNEARQQLYLAAPGNREWGTPALYLRLREGRLWRAGRGRVPAPIEDTGPSRLGPYRLDHVLGRGGMGEVYKAWDERLKRWVAIKHLSAGDPTARARFRREAQAAAQLGHPAIVQVFDVLEHDGDEWIVMELVDGPSLAELLRDGPLDPDLAVDYGRQVAAGLAAAHGAGIVHRDLKTENVMVLPSGHAAPGRVPPDRVPPDRVHPDRVHPDRVKILDFGLATRPQLGDDDASTLSLPGRILGTPRAMSPEQAQGLEVDARSDLFSFGVLLYEMLTARSPFRGRSLYEILHRVTTHQQPPVRQLNPRVPQPLSDLVDQLLEKDPARRGDGAGAVAEVLASIAAHSPYSVETTEEAGPEIGARIRTEAEKRPVVLRSWPSPELPAEPYPVLLPYTHPALLAGRDQEIAELRRLVRMPVPILGLCAPSGAGKSSLLLGGLVPALRAAPYSTERASGANSTKRACGATPVAVVRHPHEPGIAGRLLGDLLEQSQPVADDDWRGFVERLSEVEALAGEAPLLVLDQFEDVLRPRSGDPEATSPRAMLGVLLAATVRRRPGIDEPPCRWLLAYRQEFHGELIAWLGDVLYDAQTAVVDAIAALPHDLSGAERFHSMPLPLVATPQPGRDALREATRVFREAIGKPLELTRADGTPRYPWHFGPGHAERLARAFAVARLARPEAPLTPELQVVLAHLLGRAGPDGLVEVPDDPGSLIDEALEDHLRRALETAFPSGISDAEQTAARTGRARALLALRELATSTGRREEGLTAVDLARAIGEDGEEILEKLATPLTRLVVLREAPDGFRYVLSHDRMAEVVARMVEEEGRRGKLLVDAELLALRRFVSIKTALFRSQEEQATRLDRRHHRRIADHAEALLWDEERRAWGAACRKRRRADRRRRAGIAAAALIFLALVAWGAWTWARQRAEHRALREQVAEGGPEVALWAFARLSAGPDADLEELRSLLRQRFIELDLGGVGDEERSAMVLRAVEIALPWVEETPEDSVLISNLVWVLDFAPGRDPPFAERARALRDRVLRPLRRLRPPPPLPEPGNPDWVDVPAGSFQISNEGSRQVSVSAFRMLRHEVTNAEYRLLMPDQPGDDDLPAANVSWYEAYTYAAWLGGRLPTEAEWGYAARAGCPYTYCTREGLETTVDEVAWTRRNSRDPESGEPSPQPVMQLEPNPWGLFDMLGNLTEWTADWCRGPQHTWIPVARSVGSRAARGGSYTGGAQRLSFPAPYFKYVDLGFRVVLPGARPSLIDL